MPRGRNLVLLVLAAGAVLAAALVAVSLLATGSDDDGGGEGAATAGLVGGPETVQMLDGIPQDGEALGEPDAPVTLVEFADVQCPFCAEFALRALPELVDEYVRDGRLRIVYRGLAFLGPDSQKGLETAVAAGEQDRMWHVLELLFRNQGGENTGWVTDDLIDQIGSVVPGLDAEQMLADRDNAAVAEAMEAASSEADSAGVEGTPSFQLGRTGGELAPLEVQSLDAEPFRAAIDELLAP